jgi:hypothetical protein
VISTALQQRIHKALDALPSAARADALAALRASHDELKQALTAAPNWEATLRLQGAAAVIYEIIPTKERKP